MIRYISGGFRILVRTFNYKVVYTYPIFLMILPKHLLLTAVGTEFGQAFGIANVISTRMLPYIILLCMNPHTSLGAQSCIHLYTVFSSFLCPCLLFNNILQYLNALQFLQRLFKDIDLLCNTQQINTVPIWIYFAVRKSAN